MEDLKRKLDIINRVLETYHIEPATEGDVLRVWKEILEPGDSGNPDETRKSLKKVWKHIDEEKGDK